MKLGKIEEEAQVVVGSLQGVIKAYKCLASKYAKPIDRCHTHVGHQSMLNLV